MWESLWEGSGFGFVSSCCLRKTLVPSWWARHYETDTKFTWPALNARERGAPNWQFLFSRYSRRPVIMNSFSWWTLKNCNTKYICSCQRRNVRVITLWKSPWITIGEIGSHINFYLTKIFILNCWQLHSKLNKSMRLLISQAVQKLWQLYEFKMATGDHLEFKPSEDFSGCPPWIFGFSTIFWKYWYATNHCITKHPTNYSFLHSFTNYDEYVNAIWWLVAILIFFKLKYLSSIVDNYIPS